jgi:hypothetical protein
MVRATDEARYLGMSTRLTTSIKTVADHSADIIAAIEELKRNQVLVGVPAAKAPRTHQQAKGQTINNAALLYIHDNGMPSKNIPARPVVHPGIKDAQAQIEKNLASAANAAFDGKRSQMMAALGRAGFSATTSIKLRIQSNTPPPLARSTILARRRRGHTSTKTLVEFGEMRNAVNWVIRRK